MILEVVFAWSTLSVVLAAGWAARSKCAAENFSLPPRPPASSRTRLGRGRWGEVEDADEVDSASSGFADAPRMMRRSRQTFALRRGRATRFKAFNKLAR